MTTTPSNTTPTGILLDVEGTTTPINFVYEVLFPYARAHVGGFLSKHLSDEDTRADIAALCEAHATDVRRGLNPPRLGSGPAESQLDGLVAYIHWMMDRDLKSTPLKSIQGRVWLRGYRAGELKGEVFPDVPAALERWRRQRKVVSVYSSGSVLAQKLLFAHTDAGDLTWLISDHFDTSVGAKGEAESYRRIARALSRPPPEVVFISDVTAELDAARAAGMRTFLCLRPGNSRQPPGSGHPAVGSFDEVLP